MLIRVGTKYNRTAPSCSAIPRNSFVILPQATFKFVLASARKWTCGSVCHWIGTGDLPLVTLRMRPDFEFLRDRSLVKAGEARGGGVCV